MFFVNKRYRITCYILLNVLFFGAIISPASAQNQRNNESTVGSQLAKNKNDAKMHAASLQAIYEQILKDYVTENIPLSGKMLNDVKKSVTKLKVYQAYFEKGDRLKLKTVLIYLDYYSGKSKTTVLRNVARLLKEAPNEKDVTDTAIIMYLCFGEYDKAAILLKRLGGGQEIIVSSEPAVQAYTVADPNAGPKKQYKAIENESAYKILNAPSDSSLKFNGLNLLTGGMPYELLGQKISSLDFTTTHGGTYQFKTGQGQILCMLLWSLKNHNVKGEKVYLSPDAPEMLVTPPSLNLQNNIVQFNHLFMVYREYRKIAFLTGNLDAYNVNNWLALSKVQAKTPWPWPSIAIAHADNRAQWPKHHQYSQLLVMVDPKGTVFYCGPVGGYLPFMLLDIQMVNATSLPGLGGIPGDEVTKKALPRPVIKVPEKSPSSIPKFSEEVINREKVKRAVKPKSENEKLADTVQAQHILNSAIMLKKTLSYNRALTMCDRIIKDFGDTVECQQAKELVVAILKIKPRLRKYREERGLYVGSTLGN